MLWFVNSRRSLAVCANQSIKPTSTPSLRFASLRRGRGLCSALCFFGIEPVNSRFSAALLSSVLLSVGLVAIAQAANVTLLSGRISATSITKGLPLEGHETTASGDGRKKQRWSIVGAEYAHFEVIGDIQADADLAGWNCAEYDKVGAFKNPATDDSFCKKFFSLVLRNLLSEPESVANDLLLKAKKISPQMAILEVGDISVETDGKYYFIRRKSRI